LPNSISKYKNLILFDGICNFCNFWVNWLISKDKNKIFVFAGLDSNSGIKITSNFENVKTLPDSIIYLKNGEILLKSKAVLNIGIQLNGVIRILCKFLIFIGWFTFYDFVYDLIAKYRYSIFGIKKTCQIPDEETLKRFI
jgi:predicted DCC family thiol-disulfide oxidoreductase YuxK